MPASLLTLPYELRERILKPALQQTGTIELQYPIWADKSVFVHPLTQVCWSLRDEAVQIFYHDNVFVWVIDPDENNRSDPTQYPLQIGSSKDSGPRGPLISTLPWHCPYAMENIRHLRLNIYLPAPYDEKAWIETFTHKLRGLVQALDYGVRLKDLKILIGTWHTFLNFSINQSAVFDILAQMQIRGSVQIRTKDIYKEMKADVRRLDLENRMKAIKPCCSFTNRSGIKGRPGGKYLDWEWEGGALLE